MRKRANDPELTSYQYPYPLAFYDADTQGQEGRMVAMEVDEPELRWGT